MCTYRPAIEMVVAISIASKLRLLSLENKAMNMVEKKIKTYHLPEQRGELSDYWIAICDGEIEGAETEMEAIQKILNKRKDLH